MILKILVYLLQGGNFPSHGGELQFSALVLLGQHLLHLLQLCFGPWQTVLLIHVLLMNLFIKESDKLKEKTTLMQTERDSTVSSYRHREEDMWPDSSRRPEHGYLCPELCPVEDLPAPWLYSLRRGTAQSLQCPASQTAQRSRPGRWRGSGSTHRTHADHRKHGSKLWPRRSRSVWSDTLGSYTGVCRHRETWQWLWRIQ